MRDDVVRAFKDGNAPRAIELTRRILSLMHIEEMFPMYSEQYENLGRIYWAIGDRKNAEKYAQTSLDLLAEQGYITQAQRHYRLPFLLKSFDE